MISAGREEGRDRRREILEAASRVFSEKGYGGASMRAIAREAGVKQPLIYWYFEGKEDLFGAVVSGLPGLVGRSGNPEAMMDRPPEEVLASVAKAELDSYDDPRVVRLLRLVFAESALEPATSARMVGELQTRVLDFLVAYLGRQIELGRVRAHDTQSSARSFFGAVIFYFLC
ncbi:MAG: TetR/AcrR family transcriptional regulator, partial [Rubrobacter sp.]